MEMKNRKYTACVIIFLAIASLIPVLIYANLPVSEDEAYYVLVSKEFSKGAVPYRDYISDPKPPGILYILSGLFSIFSPSVIIARYSVFFFNLLSAVIIYFICVKWNRKAGLVAPLIFLIGMSIPAYEGFRVLTEPFMTSFLLLGIYFFLNYDTNLKKLFLSGIFFGLAFLFKQPAAFFIVSIFILYAVNFLRAKPRIAEYTKAYSKRFFVICAGFSLPFLVASIHFSIIGGLRQMLYWTFTVPSKFNIILMPFNMSTAFHILSFAPVFFLAVVSGIYIIHSFITNKEQMNGIFIVISAILSLIPWIFIQFGHYMIPVISLTSITASLLIYIYWKNNKKNMKIFIYIFLIISFATSSYAIYISGQNLFKNSHELDQVRLETADYVRSITSPDEKIYVFGFDPTIYLLSDRLPATSSFHLIEPLRFESQDEIIRKLTDMNVRIVIKQTRCDNLEDICDFLEKNFHLSRSFGHLEIYERTS